MRLRESSSELGLSEHGVSAVGIDFLRSWQMSTRLVVVRVGLAALLFFVVVAFDDVLRVFHQHIPN